MAIFSAENFKYGLDARRNPLSMAPGSLVELVNGHITSGGEVEKRKDFFRYTLPTGCYGLEVTDQGLTTFSSSVATGINTSTGFSVYVQKLYHPTNTINGATDFALTAVIRSTSFAGKAFVLTKWVYLTTTQYLCYYDGAFVWQTMCGEVLTGLINWQHQVLYQTAAPLLASGWTRYVEPTKQQVFLFAPVGVTGTALVSKTSTDGEFRCLTYAPVAASAAYGPSFEFQITSACTNSHLVLYVYKGSGASPTWLVTLFAYNGNLTGATAQSVADTIFAALQAYPYHWVGKAADENLEFQQKGTSIKVLAPQSWTDDTYQFKFENVDGTANPSITLTTTDSPFLTVTPSPVVFEAYSNYTSATVFTTPIATAIANGGTGPYTYSWTPTNPSSGITVSNATASVVTFSATLAPGQVVSDTFTVLVTDSAAPANTFSVSVFVSITNLGKYVPEVNIRPGQQIP